MWPHDMAKKKEEKIKGRRELKDRSVVFEGHVCVPSCSVVSDSL